MVLHILFERIGKKRPIDPLGRTTEGWNRHVPQAKLGILRCLIPDQADLPVQLVGFPVQRPLPDRDDKAADDFVVDPLGRDPPPAPLCAPPPARSNGGKAVRDRYALAARTDAQKDPPRGGSWAT